MPGHCHGYSSYAHECRHRNPAARRKARKSADPMAAGASATSSGADANEDTTPAVPSDWEVQGTWECKAFIELEVHKAADKKAKKKESLPKLAISHRLALPHAAQEGPRDATDSRDLPVTQVCEGG